MTRIIFAKNALGTLVGFIISGHSNYAPIGQDIVCASVSTIAQSTIYGIEHIVKANVISNIEVKEPTMSIHVIESGEKKAIAGMFIETMMKTIEELAIQFPEHVEFSIISV